MDIPKPVRVEGLLLPVHPFQVPWPQHIERLRHMTLRDSDVILCAFPKAGTHWLWEMCSMLLHGRASYDPRSKEHLMVEFTTAEHIEAEPSPRIINTHLPFSMLPLSAIQRQKVKMLHVYRNPKDTVVSSYYHYRQYPLKEIQDMTFDDFFQLYVAQDDQIIYGTQMKFLRQMEQFMNDNPSVPIFNVSFEHLKKNPVETVEELARYLGVTVSSELCRDVAEACSFQKMKAADKEKVLVSGAFIPVNMDIYRKGEVGDWKNTLTVAQNEIMDWFIANGMEGLTKFPMEYTA